MTLIACAACGELSDRRWCSTSCFIAEDGEPYNRFDPRDDEDDDAE